MKIRVISERQARRSWLRLVELQQRGYQFVIKRAGKPVAHLERIATTLRKHG